MSSDKAQVLAQTPDFQATFLIFVFGCFDYVLWSVGTDTLIQGYHWGVLVFSVVNITASIFLA